LELHIKADDVEASIMSLKESYDNQDAKRESEINSQLIMKLERCRADIQDQDNLNTFATKIGAMIDQFNQEAQAIQENKIPKNEDELREHIDQSNAIQTMSQKIANMMSIAKRFADDISTRLDGIKHTTLPELKNKYAKRDQTINRCLQAFNKVKIVL